MLDRTHLIIHEMHAFMKCYKKQPFESREIPNRGSAIEARLPYKNLNEDSYFKDKCQADFVLPVYPDLFT